MGNQTNLSILTYEFEDTYNTYITVVTFLWVVKGKRKVVTIKLWLP